MTEPPALKPLETEAKITVPSEAANSVIGFRDLLAGINEGRQYYTFLSIL